MARMLKKWTGQLFATYAYDGNRDLLAQVRGDFGGDTISQYDYANDALGRRTEIARSGTVMSETRTDAYGYNDRNELIYSRRRAESAEITEYAYAYDDIGNRLSSLDLGAEREYAANGLIQYTSTSNLCDLCDICGYNPHYDLDGNQPLMIEKPGSYKMHVTHDGNK